MGQVSIAESGIVSVEYKNSHFVSELNIVLLILQFCNHEFEIIKH
jgi:hypothetical protein